MKKILLGLAMVITMGLVGCGEMSVEEMEKEIVSIAEENGYEMIIIKKNDVVVEEEVTTFGLRATETPVPTPTVAATPTPVPTEAVTPTPSPTPIPTIEEESEVIDEVTNNENDSTKVWVPVTVTFAESVWSAATTQSRQEETYYFMHVFWFFDVTGEELETSKMISAEEYNQYKHYTKARILVDNRADLHYGEIAIWFLEGHYTDTIEFME